MTTDREIQANFENWARDVVDRVHPWVTGRRIWWIAAVLALAAGTALSWSWLVAIGLAPLLVAALPCAAMCALGLCMNRMLGGSCAKDTVPDQSPAKAEGPTTVSSGLTDAGSAIAEPAKREAPRAKSTVGVEITRRSA